MYWTVVTKSPALSFKLTAKKHSTGTSASTTILYSIRSGFIMRRCKQNFVFEVLSSQHHSNFITISASENVFQDHTKYCKYWSFFCKVNTKFLSSSRASNFNALSALVVSFFNENVHGLNIFRNRRVKTGIQRVQFSRLWKFFYQKNMTFFRCDILAHWRVGFFWNCNLSLTLQVQLLR